MRNDSKTSKIRHQIALLDEIITQREQDDDLEKAVHFSGMRTKAIADLLKIEEKEKELLSRSDAMRLAKAFGDIVAESALELSEDRDLGRKIIDRSVEQFQAWIEENL